MFHEGGGIVHSRFFKCCYSSQVATNLVRRCEATGRCVGSSDETTNGKPILNSEVRNLVYQVDMDSQPRRICCGFPGRTFSENWDVPNRNVKEKPLEDEAYGPVVRCKGMPPPMDKEYHVPETLPSKLDQNNLFSNPFPPGSNHSDSPSNHPQKSALCLPPRQIPHIVFYRLCHLLIINQTGFSYCL